MRTANITSIVVMLLMSSAALAQDIQSGRELAERWSLRCHSLSDVKGRSAKPRSLQSIADSPNVDAETIATFLRLPHAVMPNLPLGQTDIDDIAAYIAQMKQ